MVLSRHRDPSGAPSDLQPGSRNTHEETRSYNVNTAVAAAKETLLAMNS